MAETAPIKGFHLLVPGPIDQPTGGYAYDRAIVDAARHDGFAVAVHELAGRFPQGDAATRAAAERVLQAVPDGETVVIDGLALPALAPLLDAARRRLRLVALVHHPCRLETGLPDDVAMRLEERERAALGACSAVVVTSGHTRAMLARLDMAADNPVHVVRPGVAFPAPSPDRDLARRASSPVRLLCVASVTARKGHDVLVQALVKLDREIAPSRPSWPDWRLDCIGALDRDGPAVAGLKAMIAREGLADKIHLRGAQPPDRVGQAYAEADIFVLASRYEGYGMVLAEAMTHGLPVVATAGGAVAETVPQEAGVLVAVDDVDALAHALADLIAAPDRRARLAHGALAASGALPDWRAQARRFMDAIAAGNGRRVERGKGERS